MPGQRRMKSLETRQRELTDALRNLVDQKPSTKVKPQRLRGWAFRCRAALLVLAVGIATWVLGRVGLAVGVPVATVLLLGVPAVAVAVWRSWTFVDSDRRWFVLPVVAAVAYLAATVGELRVGVVLLIGTAAVALRWQFTRRVRGPAPLPATPEEMPLAPSAPDQLITKWEERVAARERALPGSRLTGLAPIRNGREAFIELVAGRHHTADAISATARVCSALEKPAGSVVIEPTGDRIESRARLLVLDRNPLHEKHMWPGPSLDLATGTAPCGPHADDVLARVRWLTPGSGAVNWLVAGSPGWGKSRFLDWALCESRAATYIHPETGVVTPWVHTWIADGQQGQSVPDWLDLVPWAATSTSATLRMLRAAKRVMDSRSRYLSRFPWVDDKGRARRGLKHFDPVLTGMPLLEVVVDECHAPLGELAEIVALSIEIARKGRKCGVRLVYATQVPSVQNLGGSIDLRSLLSGNVICFRTKDRISGGMAFAGGLDVDPSALPEELPNGMPAQGLGFVLGPGARPAPMRSFLVEDPYDVAVDLPVAPLHPIDIEAAGEDFATWRDRAELDDDREPIGTGPGPPRVQGDVPPTNLSPTPPSDDPNAREIVLEVVTGLVDEHGQATRAQVIANVGGRLSLRSVTDALTQLTEGGAVLRVSRGVYSLPASEVAA